MNGELVGEWTTPRTGTPLFRYTTAWSQSPRARALSLSMPITADLEVRGTVVDNYFDNLLPENPAIRRRIRERFGTRSTQAFDLLESIGRKLGVTECRSARGFAGGSASASALGQPKLSIYWNPSVAIALAPCSYCPPTRSPIDRKL